MTEDDALEAVWDRYEGPPAAGIAKIRIKSVTVKGGFPLFRIFDQTFIENGKLVSAVMTYARCSLIDRTKRYVRIA